MSRAAQEWKESGDKAAGRLTSVLLCVDTDGSVLECGLNLTISESMREDPVATTKAVLDETMQMIDFKVIEGVLPSKVTDDVKKKRLPSKMFLKVKKEKGIKVRTKARLVGGGHRKIRAPGDDYSSPTVDLTTVKLNLALAAEDGATAETIDIKGAFLNASLPENSAPVYMKLDRYVSKILCDHIRKWKKYVDREGCITVRLLKALYGLPEASKLWYEHLTMFLSKLGYTICPNDKCMLVRQDESGYSRICLHVDDFLHTYTSTSLREDLITKLTKEFRDITVKTGDNLLYLGINISFNRTARTVHLDQREYIDELIKELKVTGTKPQPARDDLFEVPEYSKPVNAKDFASKVMKIMYAAKATRNDLLTLEAFLTTRVTCPTESDVKKLMRGLQYLNGTRDKGITLSAKTIQLHAWVDASFATHADAKSHTGCIISLGATGGPIYCKSVKQKLVSRSSTEAELIALHDMLPQILWIQHLLTDLGYDKQTSVIYQDNKSTIMLTERGKTNKGKSKYISLRYFYAKEQIDKKKVKLEYLPSAEMLADYLTKPLVGTQHNLLRDKLLNN